jgi:hypothetical protein
VLVAGAPRGKIDVGFLFLAGFAAFFGGMAYGLRRLLKRTFPLQVNGLSRALAAALDTTPPLVPTDPRSTRSSARIGLVFVALQLVAIGARVAVNGGAVAGFVAAAVFAAVVLFASRASRYWTPRLEGTELRAGFRRLDLTQVNDVRARAGLMSLSDGRTRIVLTSALGRPELRDDAQSTFTSPDASADVVEQVRLYQAVDDAIGRCPLDERTATTLHRPVTMPGVSRSGPRFDPSALAPVLIMFGGFALVVVLLAAWR